MISVITHDWLDVNTHQHKVQLAHGVRVAEQCDEKMDSSTVERGNVFKKVKKHTRRPPSAHHGCLSGVGSVLKTWQEICMYGNSLENKDLCTFFSLVEVSPVTQSYQSLMMINISAVRGLRKCCMQNSHS